MLGKGERDQGMGSEEEYSSEVVKRAECRCCGMLEECTLDYIGCVKKRFGGVWVCGLCQEAIKDEQSRLGLQLEAAIKVHALFRSQTAPPNNHIAASILQLIKKIIASSSSKTTAIKPS